MTLMERSCVSFAIAAALSALQLAGCAGQSSNCGSAAAAVAAATLKRTDLSFAESGLVGGHIVLQGGKRCAIVLDVERHMPSEGLGDQFRLIASTSRHCDLLEKTTGSSGTGIDVVTLKIFAESKYYELGATNLNPQSSSLANTDAFYALDQAYDQDVNPFKAQEAQKCLGNDPSLTGTFCTTIGDMISFRLLIGKTWGGELPAELLTIFKEAFEKREKIRAAAKSANGTAAEASRLSAALLERWELRQEFRHRGAYLPDVALICLKPELLNQASASGWKTLPSALDQPAGREAAEMGEWRKAILAAWRGLNPSVISQFCKTNQKEELLETYQDDLGKFGLVQGGVVKSDVRLFAYAAGLLRKQNEVNAQLQEIWSRLSSNLLSLSGRSNIWAATNVVMNGEQSEKFVTFSMGSDLFRDVPAQTLPTGYMYRKNNTAVASPFINGESGSLFTYRGQFPLLALYSVDGKESSGGVAAIPLPTRNTTAAAQPASGTNPSATASEAGSGPASGSRTDAPNSENSRRSTGEAWRGTAVPVSGGSADAGDTSAPSCM